MNKLASNTAQLFFAAWAALCIAIFLDLHSPFWAAMPVWVVSQAYRQDLVIRGGLRVLGTLFGAAIGYAILVYVKDPILIAIIMALVVGTAAGVTYWIGTIYSYGAMITGMTTAVIVVPALGATGPDMLHYAMDRFWCTLIGVISVTVITYAFTPDRKEQRPPRLEDGRAKHAFSRAVLCFSLSLASTLVLAITGSFVAMGAALAFSIFSSVLGSLQDPRPIMSKLPIGVALGVCGAVLYRTLFYWLEPGLVLHLALAGAFILVGAYMRSHRRTAILAVDFNMCFLLAGEVGYEIHGLEQIIIGGIAMGLAALVTAQIYRILPLHRPQEA